MVNLKKIICLIGVLLSLSTSQVFAQITFNSTTSCGRGSYTTPTSISWRWGIDDAYFTPSAGGVGFYNWAASSTTSGDYVLARVEFDRNDILNGNGGLNLGDTACFTRNETISFVNSSNGTDERMGISFSSALYTFSSVSGKTGGITLTNKTMATRDGNTNIYYSVVAYFDGTRAPTSFLIGTTDTVKALPTSPSIISGGYLASAAATQGSVYSFSALSGLNPVDGYISIPGASGGYARFAACGVNTRTPYTSYCTYGPSGASGGTGLAGSNENKRWRFDFVATKRTTTATTVSTFNDNHLPYVAVGRQYAFTNSGPVGGAQLILCIQGLYARPGVIGAPSTNCNGSSSMNPPSPPITPTCSNAIDAAQPVNPVTNVSFPNVTFNSFTGTSGVWTFTQGSANVRPIILIIKCNYSPVIDLTISDAVPSASCVGPYNTAAGVLCNSYTGTPRANANFQLFRSVSSANTQCAIDGLGTTGGGTFAPVAFGTKLLSASFKGTAFYSTNNEFRWLLCARYITQSKTESALGTGNVQGKFTYKFDYN